MTLTLEISPEVEMELTTQAQSRGVAVEVVAAQVVAEWMEQEKARKRAKKLAAIAELHGMFAGQMRTVDEFLADRHAEGEADYLRGLERQKALAVRDAERGAEAEV